VRALLDENMPRSLIRLLASASFDAFITTDQGIPHQQNLNRYAIGIVLMETRSNRAEDLARLVPGLKERLGSIVPGVVVRVAE